MNWIRDFIPEGRKNRPGYAMDPQYITIHDTGNTSVGADAISHARYLKGSGAANAPVSWHFTVSEHNIVQHLSVTESAWHAGDGGTGEGNRNSIGIEICMNSDGYRKKAEENTSDLVAYLIKTIPSLLPFPLCMKQHYDWSGKNCPALLRRGAVHTWDEFLTLIKERLPVDIPEWKTEDIDYLHGLGLLNDPEGWKKKVDEPIPGWAFFIMMGRIHRDMVDRINKSERRPYYGS